MGADMGDLSDSRDCSFCRKPEQTIVRPIMASQQSGDPGPLQQHHIGPSRDSLIKRQSRVGLLAKHLFLAAVARHLRSQRWGGLVVGASNV